MTGKRIYIAGKISGECETPELLAICKNKFNSFCGYSGNPEQFYPSHIIFFLHNENWYTHGLFINRWLIDSGKGSYDQYMKNDISTMLKCDEVHFLPDWENSKGARLEMEVAKVCGIKIIINNG